MPSRTPVILLQSYSSLNPRCPTSHPASTSCCSRSSRPSQASSIRAYAQHASPSHDKDDGKIFDLSWPDPIHPHKTPTPYQILGCKRGETYAKHRFYALVKLYHPDGHASSTAIAQLPASVRLERYRMLVAAHTILSDESKRRAYDVWGHGWTGHHGLPHGPHNYKQSAAWPSHYRQWPPGHDPAHNATWEDWERWYHREEGSQEPHPEARDAFMTNFTFVSLVFCLVSLGGVMQGTRANFVGSSAMDRYDKVNKEANAELARSKRATLSGVRDERVRTFLEHREAVNAGEEAFQRLLPPSSETCDPDSTRKR